MPVPRIKEAPSHSRLGLEVRRCTHSSLVRNHSRLPAGKPAIAELDLGQDPKAQFLQQLHSQNQRRRLQLVIHRRILDEFFDFFGFFFGFFFDFHFCPGLRLRGLRIVREPPALRHFTARFEEL